MLIDRNAGDPCARLAAQLAAHAQAGYLAFSPPGGNAGVEGGMSGGVGILRSFGPGGFNAIQSHSSGSCSARRASA